MKVTMTNLFARCSALCVAVTVSAVAVSANGQTMYQDDATLAAAFAAESLESAGCGAPAPLYSSSCDSCGSACDSGCNTCDSCDSCGSYGYGYLAEMYDDICRAPSRFAGLFERCNPDNACSDGFLFGLFAPTDPGFNDFISPMTNATFFEDPRTLSELRVIFLNHKVTAGGHIQAIAPQVRAAVNDRMSLIATRAGYITSSDPAVQDGWADLTLGFKYNLLKDYEAQQILSVGMSFQFPFGSPRTRQRVADGTGAVHLFASYGEKVGCNAHWISGMGVVIGFDDPAYSDMFYWSNHLDYHLGNGWYVLGEANWYNYLDSGNNPQFAGIEGSDLFNFGSTGVAGNDIVTGAFGIKYRPYEDMSFGVAYEVPLTNRQDVFENRLTTDVIFRF